MSRKLGWVWRTCDIRIRLFLHNLVRLFINYLRLRRKGNAWPDIKGKELSVIIAKLCDMPQDQVTTRVMSDFMDHLGYIRCKYGGKNH